MSDEMGEDAVDRSGKEDGDFEGLLASVHHHHGFDFRGYKRSSLRRRIEKRMRDVGVPDYASYLALLEAEPREYARLIDNILINVTAFFRDMPAWDVIGDQIIPAILADKASNEPVRVWSAGCATGEEAYTLAMLLVKAMGAEAFQQRVKLYATDLDENALATGRAASYTADDLAGIPKALVEEFFEQQNARFLFRRELRKAIIFGRHNVITDAPISRIDLLCCRNLLIYLDIDAQAKVLPRLHYALAPNGFLFLGRAETQLGRSKLLESVDLKSRIFRKLPSAIGRPLNAEVFSDDPRSGRAMQQHASDALFDVSPVAQLYVSADGALGLANAAASRLLSILPQDVGQAFQNLQISYRPIELRSRIEEASNSRRPIRIEGVEYARSAEEMQYLDVEVTPLFGGDGRHSGTAISFVETTVTHDLRRQLATVNSMLDTTVEELQSVNEELETTNEEIQSTNEELETTNEELQSANEELQTMNEELRSTNDELEATNEELRNRSDELSAYKTYMDTVLISIRTGVIVLDEALRVTSWNRASENTWGLRAEEVMGRRFLGLDIGLPTQALQESLERALRGYVPPRTTVEGVNRRGRPIVCEVSLSLLEQDGRRQTGIVLLLDDITERRHAETTQQSLGRTVLETGSAILTFDPEDLRVIETTGAAAAIFGQRPENLIGATLRQLLGEEQEGSLRAALQPLQDHGGAEEISHAVKLKRDGREASLTASIRLADSNSPSVFVAVLREGS